MPINYRYVLYMFMPCYIGPSRDVAAARPPKPHVIFVAGHGEKLDTYGHTFFMGDSGYMIAKYIPPA